MNDAEVAIGVPEPFVREISEREGEPGTAWLDVLPGLVDHALAQWELTLSGATMHGAVGIVVPVRRADGAAAVLKISFPHPGNVAEPKALAAWAGRGAVRLLEHDAGIFAMVLEKAGSDCLAHLADAVERVVVAGRLNRRLAVPAPEGLVNLLRDRWHLIAREADLVQTLTYQLAAFAEAAELERERVVRWVQACAVKDALWSVEFREPSERAAINKIVAGIAC
ncbi:aminoglycoside phosphotransferase family protein [Kribbella flavida]|uniref:aminoglycoside phosphotransferase family protein n=1 Tax=Kribbella flavida TaxID=182640 RepID=UPI001ED8D43F|nr:aminoglycoside phosphotransferase family protein [Kribbella flavida]